MTRKRNPADSAKELAKKTHIFNPRAAVDTGTLFFFSFGAYGDTHVAVWAEPGHTSLEGALEAAGEVLADNAPGIFMDEPESEEDEVDLTYTESGWLASWEWYVRDLSGGSLFNALFEKSIDEVIKDDDDWLDDDEIAQANKRAVKLGIDVEWETE